MLFKILQNLIKTEKSIYNLKNVLMRKNDTKYKTKIIF